jgi:hypothetical protein
MIDYFISSHATVNPNHSIAVPEGCTVYFYVPKGQILPHQRAFDIFRNLSQGITPGGKVDHKITGRALVPNYSIWDLSEYPDFSGVFWVGSYKASIYLTQYTERNPLALRELFQQLKTPRSLYWLACA